MALSASQSIQSPPQYCFYSHCNCLSSAFLQHSHLNRTHCRTGIHLNLLRKAAQTSFPSGLAVAQTTSDTLKSQKTPWCRGTVVYLLNNHENQESAVLCNFCVAENRNNFLGAVNLQVIVFPNDPKGETACFYNFKFFICKVKNFLPTSGKTNQNNSSSPESGNHWIPRWPKSYKGFFKKFSCSRLQIDKNQNFSLIIN